MDESKNNTAGERSRGKILVIEDDRATSSILSQLLTEEGFDVSVAQDGDTASDLAATTTPDLVLLDLNLPGRHGIQVLREIRQRGNETGAFVPVIILTGVYTSRNDKVTSLNAGADDFLAKPFDLIELMARVKSLLRVQELYKRSQFLATHDPLTKCYNRRYLLEFMGREFERLRRYKTPLAMLLLDLDNFKKINDEKGHEAGDEVLRHVGFRLQDFSRAVDCVARLGGDEFAIVLPDCTVPDAKSAADRLVKFMNSDEARRGLSPDLVHAVGFSVGVAASPDHAQDPEALIKLADKAMYAAKKAGRNQFRLWGEGSLAA